MSTIALVDDDRDICMLLELKLRAAGHEVLVEYDGEAGLAMMRQAKPDLVVLDWMMPRLSGLEVCLAAREDADLRDMPIILLTAKAQEADVERGLRAGADDYVVKPFSPRELLSRIEARLRRSSAAVLL